MKFFQIRTMPEDLYRDFCKGMAILMCCFALWMFYKDQWGFAVGLCLTAFPIYLRAKGGNRRKVGIIFTAAVLVAIIFSILNATPLIVVWILCAIAWIVQIAVSRGWPDRILYWDWAP